MASVIQTSDDQIISYNPATGVEVGRVPQTSDEEVRAAVARSREVFHNWKTTSFAERRGLVMKPVRQERAAALSSLLLVAAKCSLLASSSE